MKVSAISANEQGLRRNFFIQYANSLMSEPNDEKGETAKNIANKKIDKTMGLETLTIFPKQVINGKTTIIA